MMSSFRFHDTVSALAYSLAAPHADRPGLQPPYTDLTAFILRQHARLPDYLRAPLLWATLAFDLGGFHHRSPATRAKKITAWRNSRLAAARDLIRYHESLATFALHSRDEPPPTPPSNDNPSPPLREQWCDVAVIGSGPGGSITACLLAEAGCTVLLIEEGRLFPTDSCAPFSRQEMELKYRHGGQTAAFGQDKISYVEACCAGGGSEINSGLYHRTPPEILEHWQKHFDVEELDEVHLQPHFEAIERTLSVSLLDHPAPVASLKLHDGARQLGWNSIEVPRWFRNGVRQSMSRTYLARFRRNGSSLLAQTRAVRLCRDERGWLVHAHHPSGPIRIHARFVFVCGGAVQTPALLLRSGISRNIGRSLAMHPTIKIAARFAEPVNSAGMGVPVHQVKEFAPRLSFGCSISTPSHLALGLLNHPEQTAGWPNMANYYAMTTPEGRGSIRLLPGFQSPFVRYRLTANDRRNLDDGLRKLSDILHAAGAVAVYPNTNLMTIHLFSSCPMGENKSRCATDSFGRVHGCANLYINDASLLCTAPGVNPQGTIMAIARRNALRFLTRVL
jgi:choline dehydrogenase-like flavoprotein